MAFGDFQLLCRNVPSYPWCNLFSSFSSTTSSASSLITPKCSIPHVGTSGSLGNIANVVSCAVSILLVFGLVYQVSKRQAAVCRQEVRLLLVFYILTLVLQLLSNGGLLEERSRALIVLTAVHAGVVAATFWVLVANAVVSTQVVDDGSLGSLVPIGFGILVFFVGTLYVALDVGLGFTSALKPDPSTLKSIPLFVLTTIWPAAAAFIYLIMTTYIVLAVLNEVKPMWSFLSAAILFTLAQAVWLALGRIICTASHSKVDGSFIGTILETGAMTMLVIGWKGITEESWDDGGYY